MFYIGREPLWSVLGHVVDNILVRTDVYVLIAREPLVNALVIGVKPLRISP